jgi:hypothetical protein
MSIPELSRKKGQGASFGIAHHSICIISNCTIGDKENVMKTSYNPHSLRGGYSIHSLQYIPGISLNAILNFIAINKNVAFQCAHGLGV